MTHLAGPLFLVELSEMLFILSFSVFIFGYLFMRHILHLRFPERGEYLDKNTRTVEGVDMSVRYFHAASWVYFLAGALMLASALLYPFWINIVLCALYDFGMLSAFILEIGRQKDLEEMLQDQTSNDAGT